jgi:L-lysine exporter family protein LysE/ArgO
MVILVIYQKHKKENHMIEVLIHGFLLALGLILPLGVQNVFVFNQGATQRRFVLALPVIITAAVCDTILISAAVLGLSVVVLGISWLKTALLIGGVGFLLFMGYSTWNSKPSPKQSVGEVLSPKKQIVFAASVSLLNPHAILDTVGVIGTNSLSYTGSEKWMFFITCIFVSWIWFLALALIGRIVGKIDQTGRFLEILNKVSALIMWGTAIYLISSIY